MTKEHPQAELLRAAADDVDALFICDGFHGTHKINTVFEYQKYSWKLYIPPKPDIVTYNGVYLSDGVIGAHHKFLCNIVLKHAIKLTINGETGKVIAEVIEL